MVGDFQAASKVMRQLVRVVRDGLHRGGRVCHRDLKTDNLLIDENGHILLLGEPPIYQLFTPSETPSDPHILDHPDLGLATHFSLSQPRLTTCCGSPAFHSPELVDALQNPPGSRTYYGPELDIWCIGLCILSLITGRKYPIGTDHKEWKVMERGVEECLDYAEEVVERRSFDLTGQDLGMEEWNEWVEFKGVVQGFMLIDGDERMRVFDLIDVGREAVDEVPPRGRKECTSSPFVPLADRTSELTRARQSKPSCSRRARSNIPYPYSYKTPRSFPVQSWVKIPSCTWTTLKSLDWARSFRS
jgi:serine/threonine protein kinase